MAQLVSSKSGVPNPQSVDWYQSAACKEPGRTVSKVPKWAHMRLPPPPHGTFLPHTPVVTFFVLVVMEPVRSGCKRCVCACRQQKASLQMPEKSSPCVHLKKTPHVHPRKSAPYTPKWKKPTTGVHPRKSPTQKQDRFLR